MTKGFIRYFTLSAKINGDKQNYSGVLEFNKKEKNHNFVTGVLESLAAKYELNGVYFTMDNEIRTLDFVVYDNKEKESPFMLHFVKDFQTNIYDVELIKGSMNFKFSKELMPQHVYLKLHELYTHNLKKHIGMTTLKECFD
ncbi:hypothetical protein K9L97_05665 [Candidatus Woesearchaeota archaeon]|nr:hypothetical protein [Candidatus Woesearchaeota archaeon]